MNQTIKTFIQTTITKTHINFIKPNKDMIYIMAYSTAFSSAYIGSAYIWFKLTHKYNQNKINKI